MVPLDCLVPVCFIISSETVCKLLPSININEAICPMVFLVRYSVIMLSPLAYPFSTIFDVSIREGYLHAIWRSAIVIPILKVNLACNISKDLRPISLTAVLSK